MKINASKITRCVIIIIYFTIMQDLLCALLYNCGIPAMLLKLVYYVKELLIISLGTACIISNKQTQMTKIARCDFAIVGFLCCIALYIFIGFVTNGIIAALMGARQYLIPMIMLIIGIYVGEKSDGKNLAYIENSIRVLAQTVIISTFIERFLIPISVWEKINMVSFSAAVKGNAGGYSSALIQNFFTGGLRRANGLAAEPLLLAYFIIPLFAYFFSKCFIEKNRLRTNLLFTLCLFLCQVLTLTRAIIVAELVGIMIVFLWTLFKNKKYNHKFFRIVLVTAICVEIVFYQEIVHMIYITLNNMDGGSAGMHMYQLKKGISYIGKFYYGLGTGTGSNLVAMSGRENLTTEFAYSNLVVDIGIIGLFLYLSILIGFVVNFFRQSGEVEGSFMKNILFGNVFCIVIWLITGVFSPQMWGMKSVLLTWFLIGVARGYMRNSMIKTRIYK